MYCPNCGKQISDGSVFCTECGAQLGRTPVQVQGTNYSNQVNQEAQSILREKKLKQLNTWCIICVLFCTVAGIWGFTVKSKAQAAQTTEEVVMIVDKTVGWLKIWSAVGVILSIVVSCM